MSERGTGSSGEVAAPPPRPAERARLLYTPAGRLRAPWRLAAFVAVLAILGFLLGLLLTPLLVRAARATGLPIEPFSWISVLSLLGAHLVMIRWVDRAGWDEAWLGRTAARPAHWIVGLLVGGLTIGLPSLLLLGVGWLRAEPTADGSWALAAARAALFLLPAALWEELLFRGYPLRVLRDAWGWTPAIVALSALFGAVHLANPGAGAQSTILVMLAGLFLGAVLVLTRSLYAAWMAHFAWNWTMAALLHAAVSGTGVATPDYRVVDAGPDWATGGPWGPEGGAAAALGMIAGLGGWWLVRRRRAGTGSTMAADGLPGARPGDAQMELELRRAAERREET